MAISTAGIFTAIVLNVIFSFILMFSTYGAGVNDKSRQSSSYKASVAFAIMSAIALVISSLVIIYKAVVSKDKGR